MLKLNHIDKYYNAGTVNEMCLFEDFSLSIDDGQFVSVVGSNGSGKTSMLNIICGSIPVDRGTIQINGQDITQMPEYRRQRRIGRVYQNPAMGTCPNMTILENMSMADHKGKFSKNEENKLSGDVIIIDESSMIDTILMYNLLKAIPNEMSVIMIGDADQLPSVNAGNVLNDIINLEVLPVIRLNKIYRQAESSKIITNSHKINSGEMPDLSSKNNQDFFFINEQDPEKIVETLKELCSQRLPNFYKVDKITDDVEELLKLALKNII